MAVSQVCNPEAGSVPQPPQVMARTTAGGIGGVQPLKVRLEGAFDGIARNITWADRAGAMGHHRVGVRCALVGHLEPILDCRGIHLPAVEYDDSCSFSSTMSIVEGRDDQVGGRQ